MDTKEYIASGILESYILGTATEQERREVECISSIYPEIRKELDALSLSMEKLAEANAVAPSAALRDKIFDEIDRLEKSEPKAEAKIVPIGKAKEPIPTISRWLAAACIALLLVSSALYYLWSDSRSDFHISQRQTDQLLKEKLQSEEALAKSQKESQQMQEQLAMLNNPDYKKIVLKGTESHPGTLASVLWNTKGHDVYLSVSNLPVAPADKQYQLWAIVDGKPVDMGVFDITSDSALYRKMSSTATAQAFAVTLEKKGGSPQPTLSAMVVLGQL